jgi:hypothetical protein
MVKSTDSIFRALCSQGYWPFRSEGMLAPIPDDYKSL